MRVLPRIGSVVGLLLMGTVWAADGPTGEQIFKKQCASCHGANGEGVKDKYPMALAGDKSVAQLSKLIAKTMPEDDPGTCVGENADKVAEYVFEAFYSKAARDRNAPPRIEFARLTVRQYRSAVADLVGSFRPAMKPDNRHGLRGEYFNARGIDSKKRSIDRIDPEVKFDFGKGAPDPDPAKFDPYQFSIRWTGSVLAEQTGTYEFVVKTEHAARLWVNDPAKPLIDVWVKSGSDTEFRAPIYLLAGRAYNLRLEFSKAKQGVDDTKKLKEKPTIKASVALEWKPPVGAAGVIQPARNLTPSEALEAYICSSAFPPDDRSYGWVRGTTISKAWDQATTDAALDAAAYLAVVADELAGVKGSDQRRRDMGSGNPAGINLDSQGGVVAATPERVAKLKAFARTFAERAFRRPLTDEMAKLIIDRPFASAKDPADAVKRVALFVLLSPRFLYREAGATPDGYEVAARLSFGLWDSIPDKELIAAAKDGKLSTREQVAKQAERMLADPRAKTKLHEFLLTWLKIDRPLDLAKDPNRFPGFDPAVIGDLRTSLDLTIDDVLNGKGSDFRRLLLDEDLFLNDRLATFYGAQTTGGDFKLVPLDPGHRAGVLSHPYLLATYAYTGETSPIHRGVFLARGILGVALRPPPEAVAPLPPDLHPGLSTRERVALQTTPNACMTCHAVINPLGFTLENFDAVGRYREKEHAKPVDATGSYQTRTGETKTFKGVRELAGFLAASEEVHASFTEQLVHHLVQQPVRAYGTETLNVLRQSFAKNDFDIKKLTVEIMATTALAPRAQKATTSTPPPK